MQKGEQIGEERGETVSFRVLRGDPIPKLEVSVRAAGKILGVDSTDLITYWSAQQPDGTLKGEGQGLTMLKDGSMGYFTGEGTGRADQTGAISYQAKIQYHNATGKLASLNGRTVLVDFDVDANWKTHSKSYHSK